MATDPVCGMAVEREHAVMGERDGHAYYFCSRGCRTEFFQEAVISAGMATSASAAQPRSLS